MCHGFSIHCSVMRKWHPTGKRQLASLTASTITQALCSQGHHPTSVCSLPIQTPQRAEASVVQGQELRKSIIFRASSSTFLNETVLFGGGGRGDYHGYVGKKWDEASALIPLPRHHCFYTISAHGNSVAVANNNKVVKMVLPSWTS